MLSHKIGLLKPEEATTPNFAQIYFVDEGVQIHFGGKLPNHVKKILQILQNALANCDTYLLKQFKTAQELSQGQHVRTVESLLKADVRQKEDMKEFILN